MLADQLLFAGALFVLSLAVGQLLVKRRKLANKILTALFAVSFVWISHGIGYRYGLLDRMPHLNKVYLPLLCVTGSMWYTYVRCLHEKSGKYGYNPKHLLMPIVCFLLSVPFYLQSAQYKRIYIETDLADWPSVFMYAATRVAELTILWFFVKTTFYLMRLPENKKPSRSFGVSRVLYLMSIVAAIATVTRIFGSIIGDKTISVLYPCLASIAVFAVMHFISYRNPVVLGLSVSSRTATVKAVSSSDMDSLRQKLQNNKWYLDPDLKVQTVARRVGMPVAELSALINGVTGMNFNGIINQYRIDYAKKLLLTDTNKTVLNVAYESGYNSKSAFYKHFSDATSMTPVQYRKIGVLDRTGDLISNQTAKQE